MKDITKEADKYFARNKTELETFSTDVFREHILPLIKPGMKVLEVGCMNGYRLHEYATTLGAECYGVDPSQSAIEDGKKLFPEVHLTESPSHILPYEDATFDIVYMNFVLYLVPREFVYRTASEMDRVLKDGGRLIIADFFPDAPHRRPDRHATDEYTYKFNFWELFTASNLYKETAHQKYGFRHEVVDESRTGGDNDSIVVDLEKSLTGYFPTRNI